MSKKKRVRLSSDSLDLIARKILMASFLYYGLGESPVSDHEFDEWCRKAADNWDGLDRQRQWQLGSPEQIRATGFHVKCTYATIGGAWSWMTSLGRPLTKQVTYTQPWNWNKRYRVHWLCPEHFRYGKEMSEVLKRKGRKDKCQTPKSKKRRVRLQPTKRRIRL